MFAHFDDLMSLYVHLCVWVFRAWGRREASKSLEAKKPVHYETFSTPSPEPMFGAWVIWGRSAPFFYGEIEHSLKKNEGFLKPGWGPHVKHIVSGPGGPKTCKNIWFLAPAKNT